MNLLKILVQSVFMIIICYQLYAKDEILNENFVKKAALVDLEVTGTLLERNLENNKDKNNRYQLKTNANQFIILPIQENDKDIDVKQYLNKEVIVKGKGSNLFVKTTKGCLETITFNSVSSIELKLSDVKKLTDDNDQKSKQKEELVALEATGILTEVIRKGAVGSNYTITSSDKKITYLTNKIGEKEINFDQYKGKNVIAKGKGVILYGANHITDLSSIELKVSETENKKDVGNQAKD